ncbi:hypothetical protein VFPBJ_11535 [Purpureocillium lilacinum]|uniref:Uncharacterized protein n=1 Tax=Purpureocillium lilacinum TaxID=33203 RepID=A0A179F5X1_PURLI|nr:hypothetical protein VFPBJ_11535 [Purpureocillium lilacinum]
MLRYCKPTLPCKISSRFRAVSSLIVRGNFTGHPATLSPSGPYRGPNSPEGGTIEDLRRVHLQSHEGVVLLDRTYLQNQGACKPYAASVPFQRFFPPATPGPFLPPDSWGADRGSGVSRGARELWLAKPRVDLALQLRSRALSNGHCSQRLRGQAAPGSILAPKSRSCAGWALFMMVFRSM